MNRAAGRRLKKLEGQSRREDEPPPWVLEGREPSPVESLMWALDHGRTLEEIIRGGLGVPTISR